MNNRPKFYLPISTIRENASLAAFLQLISKSVIRDLADNSKSYEAIAVFNKEKKVVYVSYFLSGRYPKATGTQIPSLTSAEIMATYRNWIFFINDFLKNSPQIILTCFQGFGVILNVPSTPISLARLNIFKASLEVSKITRFPHFNVVSPCIMDSPRNLNQSDVESKSCYERKN